jgi:hypothetical protein
VSFRLVVTHYYQQQLFHQDGGELLMPSTEVSSVGFSVLVLLVLLALWCGSLLVALAT